MRLFKKESDAVKCLTDAGVAPKDQGQYITKLVNGTFDVDIARARKDLHKNDQCVSRFVRRQILEGKSNKEIFKNMRAQFGNLMTDKHKYYPAWYRSELRRHGKLPAAFDFAHQDPNAIHRLEE